MKSFQRSLMFGAVNAALCNEAEADASTGGGESSVQGNQRVGSQVEIPEKVESWLSQGKHEGARIQKQQAKADMLAADVLLTYGSWLADASYEASRNDFLTGYASGWTNPQTGKVRKSEAKAVFDAFVMGETERALVVGYDKEAKQPIKESREISEWLMGHEELKGYEGYGGLIRLAKELRGPASGSGAGGGAKRKTVVTDKQQGEVEERIPLMNASQVTSTIEKAIGRVTASPMFETILFREMQFSCNQIKVKSKADGPMHKAHIEAASAILDIIEAHLAVVSAQQAHAAGAAPVVAPAPAAAPAPATETVEVAKTGTNG